jgi:4-alpha-glucanotransferase
LGEAAEDSRPLKEMFNIPGMKILQMSFGNNESFNGSIPALDQKNIVVYTGTHDNDTSIGWFKAKPGKGNIQSAVEIAKERKQALDLLGTDGSEINWDFISYALNSKSNTAIIPLQDILGLDSKARMNIPGTIAGNWEWRFQKDQLTKPIMKRMKILTEKSNRLHK